MKFVEAVWDTRNLGLRCLEIEFTVTDSVDELVPHYEFLDTYEYITAKIPAGNYPILQELQKKNFRFVENLFGLEHDLREIELPRYIMRFEPHISFVALSPENYELVFNEIDKGLFETDRISLDDYFTPAVTARRYKNWILDEAKGDFSLLQVYYKDNAIGFFSHVRRGDISYPFLASLYKDSQRTGLGANLINASTKYAREHGFSKIETVISSNNLPIVRIHESLGYSLKKVDYVLTRNSKNFLLG